jgi:hypothetical protein
MSAAGSAGRHRAPRRFRSRRTVAGAALAGAALALPGWFVVLPAGAVALGSASAPVSAGMPVAGHVAEPEPDPAAAPPRRARDPFEPLIGSAPAEALADPAAAVAVAGATAGLPAPLPSLQLPEAPAAAPVAPAAPPPAVADPAPVSGSEEAVLVRLLDAYSRDGVGRVSVALDGVVLDLAHGEVFADVFRVTAVTEPCAAFAAGSETFTLCEGEERSIVPPPPTRVGASVSTR